MGSAALRAIAVRGASVLGIEARGIGHALGSSHGETRIIRKAYFEHPDYVPLLERAYTGWGRLERDSNEKLFERTGLVLVGDHDGVVIEGVREARRQHGLDIEEWDVATLRARTPFEARDGSAVLFERDAGFLHVERGVGAHVETARRDGAEVRDRCEVDAVDGDGVIIDGARETARTIVVCAGPWSGRLLGELGLPLTVMRRVQLWFDCADARFERCPVFAYAERNGFFYGFPRLDGATVKIALHGGDRSAADPDALDRALREDDVEPVRRFAAERLPSLSPSVARHATCMYTMTPDEHFVVGARDRVVFAAGFSGHGYKFAPVIGEILADLALEGATDAPIALFAPDRFASG